MKGSSPKAQRYIKMENVEEGFSLFLMYLARLGYKEIFNNHIIIKFDAVVKPFLDGKIERPPKAHSLTSFLK
jgi:hypothetical protein